MKPFVKEFADEKVLMEEVIAQSRKGIAKENLYVISHDEDRTERVAENTGANTVGIQEEGLLTAVGNVFKTQGDELRSKFKELGFSQLEANELEEKLDRGKILLIITEPSVLR